MTQLSLTTDELPCSGCGQPHRRCVEKRSLRGMHCCSTCRFTPDAHGAAARQEALEAAEAELQRVDTRHRTGDHPTSIIGARAVRKRGASQQMQLLIQYALHADAGLTDGEAAHHADLLPPKSSSPWKRCNELRDAHLIEQPAGNPTRIGAYGAPGIVCVITELGVAMLREKHIYPEGH